MYQDNPGLTPELNAKLRDMELAGGIWYDKLPVGSVVEVQTKNTRYILEKRSDTQSFIQGNAKYCPIPTECRINGSTFGGSMIRIGWLGVGMFLEFQMGGGTITTSQIESVRLLPVEA